MSTDGVLIETKLCMMQKLNVYNRGHDGPMIEHVHCKEINIVLIKGMIRHRVSRDCSM